MKPNGNNQKRSCNYKKTLNTLDYCHKNNLFNFENNKSSLHNLELELKNIVIKIDIINKTANNEKTDEDFIEIVRLNDTKQIIERKVGEIKSNTVELNYFISTSDILYNYYNLVENNNDSVMNINSQFSSNSSNNKKSILDYFKHSKFCESETSPKKHFGY